MKSITLYSKQQFEGFKKQLISSECELISFSQIINQPSVIQEKPQKGYCIDLSSLIQLLKENSTQTLSFEQILLGLDSNISFACDKAYEDDLSYIFRFVFDEIIYADVAMENTTVKNEDTSPLEASVKKITDLDETELQSFFDAFNSRLYGHDRFKMEFREIVESFRVFNKLGEHKVLSLFLMGDSGVGKTEVARSIHKALGSKAKLAKVNFGNYSSHDALNSLIGSPLGYIGSDGGELVKRMKESDVGLILIDEFEKADGAVFNYFLDVLENGKIVNSQAEEYDVSGYIIVFTSNISKEDFMGKISPELRSRFDYKGIFNLLTDEDKQKFVHFRVNQIISKYTELVSDDLSAKLHDTIVGEIDVSQYNNMRDLNKKIKDTFVISLQNSRKN